MADSIVNNKEFRALLTRKGGATGRELQAFTGRAYPYSVWSLRCMTTEDRSLFSEKVGRETRYMLLTAKQEAALIAKAAAAEQKAAQRKPANTNEKPIKPANSNDEPAAVPAQAMPASTRKPRSKRAKHAPDLVMSEAETQDA